MTDRERNAVQRVMKYDKDYVSCIHCACCYGSTNEPTFCQVFSFPVDPTATEQNEEVASKCANWVPNGTRRDKTLVPDVKRWYEELD